MKYKCLVFDHDDTVVNSTATIHYPCFIKFIREYYPGKDCSLEEYFLKNFSPGFVEMCRGEYGMDDAALKIETEYWSEYVKDHIPAAYPGIREIMERQKAEGGLVTVVSHSFEKNIRRDYRANGLPAPDAAYGWERPLDERKPNPFPLLDIMRRFSLKREDILMIDDLKPGYDMAAACGVDFAAVGWSNDIPQIESFMRKNCRNYFKKVSELSDFLSE
ncbi:MAG: HAD family hydrolase [Candidatus Limivicinus sp.]|jgi:phosphoglycolate phosphatase